MFMKQMNVELEYDITYMLKHFYILHIMTIQQIYSTLVIATIYLFHPNNLGK